MIKQFIYSLIVLFPIISFPQSFEDKIGTIRGLTDSKQWDEALKKSDVLLSETEKQYGKEHINTATVLNWTGYICDNSNRFEQAETAYLRSLEIALKHYPENNTERVMYYENLAYLYYNYNKHKEAIPYYEKLLKIITQPNPNNYYWSYYVCLAHCYFSDSLTDKALEYYTKIEKNHQSQNLQNLITEETMQTRLGLLYKHNKDFERAEPYLINALENCKIGSRNPIDCIIPLENLGDLYFDKKDYVNADRQYATSWNLQQNTNRYDSYLVRLNQYLIEINTYLNKENEVKKYCNFLWDYLEKHNKGEVLHTLNQSAKFFKENNSPDLHLFLLEYQSVYLEKNYPNHSDYPIVLHNLGKNYKDRNNFTEAEKYLVRSVEYLKKNKGEEHQELLTPLETLISTLTISNKPEKAKEYITLRDKIIQKAGTDSDIYYLNQLKQVAILNQTKEFDKSLTLLNKIKPYFEKQKEINTEAYIDYLQKLSVTYSSLNQYEKAAPVLMEGFLLTENKLEFVDDYVLFLIKISEFYVKALDYETAVNLLSLGINTLKELPLQKGIIELVYARLAYVYTDSGEYKNAEQIFNGIIPVMEEVYGKEHQKVYEVKNNYAVLLGKTKDFAKAEKTQKELEKMTENNIAFQKNKSTLYYNLGVLTASQNKTDEAISYYRKFIDEYLKEINTTFTFLSESEKDNFVLATIHNQHYLMNFYHSLSDKSKVTDDIFRLQSSFRGMILQSSVDVRKKWKSLENPEISKLLNKWEENRNLKNTYLFEGDDDKALQTQYVLDNLEREMSIKIPDYASQKLLNEISWKQLQSELKSDEVIIDFVQFEIGDVYKGWDNNQQYAALIISPKSKELIYQPLFKQSELNAILKQDLADANANQLYRGSVIVSQSNKNQGYGKQLYDILWKPLEKYLSDTSKIYYIPSGSFYQLAVAAIPVDDNRVLMEKYNLFQRSGYKEFLEKETLGKPQDYNFQLFGGIDYDATLNISQKNRTNASNSWSYLKGTLEEVEMLSTIISSEKVKVYKGSEATEKVFYEVSQSDNPKVLHIATHGYFFSKPPRKLPESELQGLESAENPLLRSGLIFAGGNHAWTGNEPQPLGNDGILSASEVNNLNLEKTDLVVLSACETGLGDIDGTEGVFGLQRAFRSAGAKYLLMSLWKVPDKETSEFMQHFYTEWHSKGNIEEAFRFTQKIMKNKYPKDPYKWAAFVLVR